VKPFTTNPSIATLEDTPPRALEFLRGVGASPEILRLLSKAGYTKKVHEEGLQLLTSIVSLPREKGAFHSVSAIYEAAVKEVTTWQKKDLRRIKATVTRFHPAEAEYLFSNLDFSPGVDAVLMVSIFLDRLASLANDPDRKATRKADHAVLETIKERGVTDPEIKHLRGLVKEAQTTPVPDVVAPAETDARVEALRALRAWYTDWAETARTVLTRRDHLIRVGLATRKRTQTPAPPAVTPVVPSPAVAPDAPAMLALPMSSSTTAA
jgi:hypothetical protein